MTSTIRGESFAFVGFTYARRRPAQRSDKFPAVNALKYLCEMRENERLCCYSMRFASRGIAYSWFATWAKLRRNSAR